MSDADREVFYVVAGDPIEDSADVPHRSRSTRSRASGEAPTVAAEARSVGLELFPMPDGDTDGIQWVDGPAGALVELPATRSPAEGLRLADRSGALFAARQVVRLAAVPQGRLRILHPGAGAAPFDIVLLSEGFAAADEEAFFAQAGGLCQAFLAIEPYRSCSDRLRVAALFLPSPGSGITETKCSPSQHYGGAPCPALNQTRATLFGTSNLVSGYCRLIAGNEDRVRQALKADHVRALFVAQAIGRTRLAVVVVNTRVYGGAGAADTSEDTLVVWTAPTAQGGAVMAHEMGHALGLQDEYEDSGTGLPSPSNWVNISNRADPSRTPWHCLATDQDGPFPTCSHHAPNCSCDPATIGTFEGAGHKPTGRYRPTKNCGMRTTGAPFCRICSTHIANRLSGVESGLCPG